MPSWPEIRHAVSGTARIFFRIDGAQRAAAFAYYAFFSLFPLAVLFVTIGSIFVGKDVATHRVIGYFETFTPADGAVQRQVFDVMTKVVKSRGQFSTVAVLVLVWSSLQFFKALIQASIVAWDSERMNWWRMPLKSLLLLALMASALALRFLTSLSLRAAWTAVSNPDGTYAAFLGAVRTVLPTLILFYALALFYMLAPRRKTLFSEVWLPALAATLTLRGLEFAFLIYLRNFSQLNALYGAFGGIMALLLWIYLSGCVVVLGACLAASIASTRARFAVTGSAVPRSPSADPEPAGTSNA